MPKIIQMVLEYLQLQSKACASLCFSASAPRIGYLLLCIKACRRNDLSRHLESAWLVTWNRGQRSNSAPPMSSDQMPHPRKTKFLGRKDVKCPWYALGGGMFKLRFDWYIMLRDWSHDFVGYVINTVALRLAHMMRLDPATSPCN